MKTKLLSLILLVPILLSGCDLFDEGDVEKTYDDVDQIALFPLEDNNNLGINVTSTTIQVQLITADGLAKSDVSVAFSAAGTATAGTDYSFGTASPITIAAGSATADIVINFVVSSVAGVTTTGIDVDADSARTAGTYAGITATGGSGTGATFDVTIDAGGQASIAIATAGTGYTSSDSFTVAAASIGATGPDLTFDVSDLTGSFAGGEVQIDLSLDASNSVKVAGNLGASTVYMAK